MKTSKIIKAILSPVIKGLAIFAIFGFALYVYGAISYPENEPNPVSGVVGIFLGTTQTKYTAGVGYSSVNDYCKTGTINIPGGGTIENAKAHVCTSGELINSYNNGVTTVTTQTGIALINNGPPGYLAFSNDCLGWTNISGTKDTIDVYGAYWNFDSDYGLIGKCSGLVAVGYPFACCK